MLALLRNAALFIVKTLYADACVNYDAKKVTYPKAVRFDPK